MSLNLKIFGVLKNIFLQWETCDLSTVFLYLAYVITP